MRLSMDCWHANDAGQTSEVIRSETSEVAVGRVWDRQISEVVVGGISISEVF